MAQLQIPQLSLLLLLALATAHVQASPPQAPLARSVSPTRSGPSTPPAPVLQLPGPAQEYLAAHNQARAEVGVGPLKWSPALANATARLTMYQRLKNKCQPLDLNSGSIKYGANQLWARGLAVSPTTAVGAWVAEKKFYNRAADSCAGDHRCGVYKQVVWRKSAKVGCAQANCAKDGSSLTVCFYNPPGNIIGEGPY